MPRELSFSAGHELGPLEEANLFLARIRPRAVHWVFQTFDDRKDKSPSLAQQMTGDLNEHGEKLLRLNAKGAGIFATINKTDGKGRRRGNIVKIRAVTLDLDGSPLDPVLKGPLKPHLIIESSRGKYHVYWCVKGLALDQYEDVQRSIAQRFDGDPSVALLTHVARLPGFNHMKGDPFRTSIVKIYNHPAFSADEVLREFPPLRIPHRTPKSRSDLLILSPSSPRKTAEEFVKRVCMVETASAPAFCLHYYRGGYYEWSNTHFRQLSIDGVRSKIYSFLDDAWTHSEKKGLVPFDPNASKVNQVLDALRAGTWLRENQNPPFWIGSERPDREPLIACGNGLLNIESRELTPHDPLFFNVNCLPFDYDPDAPFPKEWLRFLKQLWPEDKQARRTLQEIFGLMLTPDTRHQKIFMLRGPKRSGKGTIGRVLTALLGKDSVVNPTLASLSTHFGLSTLIDKRAAIISDARLGTQTDGHLIAERLLSISGEDSQTIDIKYRSHWTGQLSVRFLILTNELPRIADASGALASRFVLLTLKNSFYDREDLGLTEKLLSELPGILNWSLRGLDRLRQRGYFEIPTSSKEEIRALEDLASPVGAFLRDWCVDGPTERTNVKELYDAWTRWCEFNGHKPGSSAMFGRNLRAAKPHVTARGAGADRFYQGVGLKRRRRFANRYS